MASTKQLLRSLKESIIDKPPYISGTLNLPDSHFSLFYKVARDGHAARHIDLANATPDELEQLAQACEPASGMMGSDCFSPTLNLKHTDMMKIIRECLLEGYESRKPIKNKLHKLNVRGSTGSFVELQVDTLESNKMFGSIVVIFPTPHEGGALLLQDYDDHELTFDSEALAAKGQPSIGYLAFIGDVELTEVAPVTSGHRVSFTYGLYFDDGGPVFANDANSRRLIRHKVGNEDAFREAFTALLENPEFLPEGGVLAFGMMHVYTINGDITHLHSILKGSDAVVYRTACALGYEPMLCMHYSLGSLAPSGLIVNKLVDFDDVQTESELANVVYQGGGGYVSPEGHFFYSPTAPLEPLEWVTPMTTFNEQTDAFPTVDEYNEPITQSLEWVYGNICLVVRIGKAGERLTYRTVAERQKEYPFGLRFL